MKKIMKRAGLLLLTMVLGIMACTMTAFADGAPKIKIPVNVNVSGNKPSTAEKFNVVLKAQDAGNPMPEGSVEGVYTAVIDGGSNGVLEMEFQKLGIYKYTIKQEPGASSKGTYDDKVYNLTVYVTNAETGGMESTTILYIDDINTKYGSVDFANNYRGGGGGGGGNTNKTKITPPDPELENITENDVPLGDGGLLDIIDDMIPLAVLPATGTLWWLAAVLAAVGAMMFLMGFYRNRSYSKDEE